MSTPNSETPHPSRRLVDRIGTSPDLERSDGWHWRLVVAGVVLFALNTLPEPADQYVRLLALCMGLTLVSWGASGLLLRRGNEALSLWFSAFRALLFFPTTALLFLAVCGRFGLPWAVGLALAACAFYAVARKRSSRYDEGGA